MSSPETRAALFDAILTPYRSLSPRGFTYFMLALGGVSLAAGIGFAVQGAWPVLGFFGLDVLAVYVAFRASYAQAKTYERVRVDAIQLTVEAVPHRGPRRSHVFPSYWARAILPEPVENDTPVLVGSHGRHVAIGRFLSVEERQSLARALNDALQRARAAG